MRIRSPPISENGKRVERMIKRCLCLLSIMILLLIQCMPSSRQEAYDLTLHVEFHPCIYFNGLILNCILEHDALRRYGTYIVLFSRS